MNKRQKKQLIFLLKVFRKDIVNNWPKGNNLHYELALNDLDLAAESIVIELESQLKENYSFRDLR